MSIRQHNWLSLDEQSWSPVWSKRAMSYTRTDARVVDTCFRKRVTMIVKKHKVWNPRTKTRFFLGWPFFKRCFQETHTSWGRFKCFGLHFFLIVSVSLGVKKISHCPLPIPVQHSMALSVLVSLHPIVCYGVFWMSGIFSGNVFSRSCPERTSIVTYNIRKRRESFFVNALLKSSSFRDGSGKKRPNPIPGIDQHRREAPQPWPAWKVFLWEDENGGREVTPLFITLVGRKSTQQYAYLYVPCGNSLR